MFAIWTCVFKFKNFFLIRTREATHCKLKFQSFPEHCLSVENWMNLLRKLRRW
ncbi:hypothetical protein LEP1GSC161_1420 [Leptospira santarosai str. CBC1416]|uniref:Uncharacterized protein n=4 Tax=Leptospira santarosai TaxID=28183 RepID=M6UHP5_9LEPT|nr:hypothetical protein LEP1GSC179_3247 [Leptospira santarosai str. MOR084]EKO78864.1 hypothetical protein LEP1GSC068_2633 [Leptospira sp. Fiocruz LV3954]EKR90933.1 hypothetical protein LEP1GSC163_4001 [Leptospira santarosai str. CBC379]EKS09794.1 hypothetical protein LEP1GSC071_2444 [Leptospira santarosai str. JET]EMF92690.1 hypothetical protein LEP1GSC005_3239 [Leptospira santarosai str. ST188]EMI69634.1 hypothetical protein LEP1GSC076_2889 [Leptospira sp. Fiocruz LV4135]EMJ51278.1 hypothet